MDESIHSRFTFVSDIRAQYNAQAPIIRFTTKQGVNHRVQT